MKNERKEELKDKMKNRISLALKDPILQQGFEIICKENAELKHQLEHRNCLDCSNHSSNLRMRNLDLEKENAELEEKISVLLSCKNCPENKDGLLCQKEYEDKCLAQKIQYIKELKEQNTNLQTMLKAEREVRCNEDYLKRVTELEAQIEKMKWHKLDWDKAEENPDVDKLVRVKTRSGAEYICETYSYFPAEDEIGYGSVITQFAELNGDWVDDNEIEYWCYIEPFKEIKEND